MSLPCRLGPDPVVAGTRFLLKYASRDEVELLDRGNGGVVEVRNAVAQYEEKSPLYGFLRYRRRNVIIKYLPEDCSRLVQGFLHNYAPTARVTVHFNSVCDRFSPFDTAFSITEAKELKDTKLSAACSLHAASGSTSSSTSSLRRRRLMEIAEEEEDEERDRKRQSIVKEEDQLKSADGARDAPAPTASETPVTLNADLANSPEASKFAGDTDPPHFIGVHSPPSPTKSFDDGGRRMSSQSARPDLYTISSYTYGKPRVKLAPRPSADLSGRPRTSAGNPTFRPVSTIPAGLKLTKTPKKGKAQDLDDNVLESPIKEEAETPFSSASSPGTELSPANSSEPPRPHTSGGTRPEAAPVPSFKANLPSMPPPPTKQNTMTPEKQRLLKAMKLREKKMQMHLQPTDLPMVELSSAPNTPGLPEQSESAEVVAGSGEPGEAPVENGALLTNRLSVSKADSAIGIDVGADQASLHTQSDSHPTSPLANSDIGDSTQASSLSESTDETVLAEKEKSLPPSPAHDDISTDDDDDFEEDEATDDEQPALDKEDDVPSVVESLRVIIGGVDGQIENSEVVESESGQQGEAVSTMPENKVLEVELVVETEVVVPSLPISKFSAGPMSPKTATSQVEEVQSSEPEDAPLSSEQPAEGNAGPQSPQIKIPVSKFSTQENKSPTTTEATIPSIVAHLPDTDDTAIIGTEEVAAEEEIEGCDLSDAASVETGHSKRKGAPEPIRTDFELPEKDKRQSVVSFMDDDLIDELQSATLQQAKPITVSKSPMSPYQSNESTTKRLATGLESGSTTPRIVRTVSNPIRGPLLVPGDVSTSSARTVSSGAAFLHKITQQSSAAELRPKSSSKIGSSISQRIKALEKLSSSSVAGGDTPPKERPGATFFSVRKPSVREPSRSPSVVDRANSLTRVTTPTPLESGESSPESGKTSARDRTGSMVSRLSVFEGGKPPRGRPESIQVTARIIRDPAHRFPKVPEPKADPADFEPLNLKESPLLVDVQKRSHSPSPLLAPVAVFPTAMTDQTHAQKPSLLQRRFSKERRSQSQDRGTEAEKEEDKDTDDGRRPRRRSSLTVVKDFIKDRRESLLGVKSPSTDNLGLSISPGNLASPAIPTPSSKSPSRPPSVHQNSIFPRRISMGSRRSSMEQSSPTAALSATNLASASMSPPPRTADGDSEAEGRSLSGFGDKKSGSGSSGSNPTSPTTSKSGSRATRFMRRLSNSLSSSRKNVTPSISPTVAEEEDAEVEAAARNVPQSRGSTGTGAPSYIQPTVVAYMGDVNVQFPDNLLWKRRTICLDSQGFLILSAVQGGTATVPLSVQGKDRHHQAGTIKRYHMSDFKPPYTPEMEVQELPNSVILDFVDGSGLQIACEDRAGQANVLRGKLPDLAVV
ncbi:hypothetical protein OQA88_539 [Cercophora sp. LCS_1]